MLELPEQQDESVQDLDDNDESMCYDCPFGDCIGIDPCNDHEEIQTISASIFQLMIQAKKDD